MGWMRRGSWVIGLGALLAATPAPAAQWEISVYGGLAAGGELFRAKTVDEVTQAWPAPDGRSIEGTEIQTELDEIFSAGVRVRRQLTPAVSLQLGLGGADMDVGGTRRTVARSVDEIVWDQVFVLVADLTAHYDLVPGEGSTPYVLAGLGFVSADFEDRPAGAPNLDQSGLGVSLGLGYRWRALDGFHFDLEVRDTIQSLDTDPEAERLAAASTPEIEVDGEDRLHFWQISVAWVFGF